MNAYDLYASGQTAPPTLVSDSTIENSTHGRSAGCSVVGTGPGYAIIVCTNAEAPAKPTQAAPLLVVGTVPKASASGSRWICVQGMDGRYTCTRTSGTTSGSAFAAPDTLTIGATVENGTHGRSAGCYLESDRPMVKIIVCTS